jgi:tetratricopeptide (TPR) repeat protein
MNNALGRRLAAALPCLVAACANIDEAAVPANYSAAAEPERDSITSRVVTHRRALAQQLQAKGDMAGAAAQWHILALVAPDEPAFREARDRAHAAMKRVAADEYKAALASLKRGESENGMNALLRVLAYEPDHADAVRLLRAYGQERASKAQAERAARLRPVATAGGTGRTANRRTSNGRSAEANNGYDLDQSLELLRSGDATVALTELRRIVEANPTDRALRRRVTEEIQLRAVAVEAQGSRELAVILYEHALALGRDASAAWRARLTSLKKALAAEAAEKAQRAYKTDVAQAIEHWETSLRYDPNNAATEMRLREAKKLYQRLRQIEKDKARRE